MSSQPSNRAPRCGIDGCRSRRYHIESGHRYCSNGHLQEGFIEQTQEYEDINWSASQTTRIRDSQKQAETAAHIDSLSGDRGLSLFLQAFQLLLRKQLQAFERLLGHGPPEQGEPSELEAVVRDLWRMRLQVLGEHGLEIKGDSSKRKSRKKKGLKGQNDSDNPDGAMSQSETDTEVEEDEKRDLRPPRSTPKLIETIAVLYLGSLCLRIPVPLSKLQEWIQMEELYWIRAANMIPEDMRDTLAASYQTVFLPYGPLRDGKLHKSVAQLVVMLQDHFPNLRLPALNYKPILLDYLVRLALPLQLYEGVVNLVKLMQLDFTTTSLKHLSSGWLVHELPDMQVIALIVIATKLYYPFDDSEYYARNSSDLAALKLDWVKWNELHVASEKAYQETKEERLDRAHQVKVEPKDVYSMGNEEMDAYMDWYHDQWANMEIPTPRTTEQEEVHDKYTQHKLKVFGIFPPQAKQIITATTDVHGKREEQRLAFLFKDVPQIMSPRDIVTEKQEAKSAEPVRRMGAEYAQYRHMQHLEQHRWAKAFHLRVAQVAGLPLSMLLTAVLAMEERMATVKNEVRRSEEWQSDAAGPRKSRTNSIIDPMDLGQD